MLFWNLKIQSNQVKLGLDNDTRFKHCLFKKPSDELSETARTTSWARLEVLPASSGVRYCELDNQERGQTCPGDLLLNNKEYISKSSR